MITDPGVTALADMHMFFAEIHSEMNDVSVLVLSYPVWGSDFPGSPAFFTRACSKPGWWPS